MTQAPMITVVMPCFNGEHLLARAIASVFNQSFSDLELIVVNDGSTDTSADILNSITDQRLVLIHQANSGVCRARNNALSIAKGQFIAFLDTDDYWDPECLNKLYQALAIDSEAVLAYCGWQNIGLPGGTGEPFVPPNYETPTKQADLFENCRWPIHATLTRHFAIIEAGGFDERILTSEDFLLWLKIGYQHRVVLVPEVLAYYQHHDRPQASDNIEKTAINHWLAQQLFIQENRHVATFFGKVNLKKLMHGELLRRGYNCYWKRDIRAARSIFKQVMKSHYGTIRDWKYMLPSLLPYSWHLKLIEILKRVS